MEFLKKVVAWLFFIAIVLFFTGHWFIAIIVLFIMSAIINIAEKFMKKPPTQRRKNYNNQNIDYSQQEMNAEIISSTIDSINN